MEGITVKREKLTWSAAEAAEIVGVSTSKMYEMMRIEGFPTIKLGRRMVVAREKLLRWLEENTAKL